MPDDAVDAARTYYRALDEHDYDALAPLLAPEFVHDRPDMTLTGRERFVRFMREERPQTNTTHQIAGVYREVDAESETTEVVARGRLLSADGERITDFVDVFTLEAGDLVRIETYAR